MPAVGGLSVQPRDRSRATWCLLMYVWLEQSCWFGRIPHSALTSAQDPVVSRDVYKVPFMSVIAGNRYLVCVFMKRYFPPLDLSVPALAHWELFEFMSMCFTLHRCRRV